MIAPLTFTQISDVSPTTCYGCALAQTRPADAQLDTEALLAFRTVGDMSLAIRASFVVMMWAAVARACACSNCCLRWQENADAKSPGGWRRSRRRSRRHTIPHYYALKISTSTTSTSTRNRCSCVGDEVQLDDPFVEFSTSGIVGKPASLVSGCPSQTSLLSPLGVCANSGAHQSQRC